MVNRFNEQRTKRNLSISELSERSGIPEEELDLIESSSFNIEEMSAAEAARIAETLGCLISDLIYE